MSDRTCVECGSPVVRTATTGIWPLRCPEHREARERAKRREISKRYRDADPERAREQWNRNNRKRLADPEFRRQKRDDHLLRVYGLTPAQLEAMIAAQDGKCAICLGPPCGPGARLHIDHCHDTGKVRALLCGKCNTLIGLADHEPERLLAAALYLEGAK